MDSKIAACCILLDDDDEEELRERRDVANLSFLASVITTAIQPDEKSRIRGYVETVVPGYSDYDFRRMFRMCASTFTVLLEHIQEFDELQPAGPGGRDPIPLEKQLLLTLWYVGGTDTIAKIADRFGLSESSVILGRNRILMAILKLTQKLIVWPSQQQLVEEEAEFKLRNGFPGIVGAVDGTHIRIKAPHEHPQSYVNRKGFHSIQLQCVCKHNMLFSDVFTGYPGSCHDSRVLRNSDLWNSGQAKCNVNYHILGDGAYPLRKWLLTPYRDNGHLTRQEKKYNYYHSSNRVVIERAFALLKNRFRRLQFIDTTKISTAVDIIMASCILHNICIMENDSIEEFLQMNVDDEDGGTNEHNHDQNAEGAHKRENIARDLV